VEKNKIKEHFNNIAKDYLYWKKRNGYYFEQVKNFYKKMIPCGQSILEIGCGTADVMEAVRPKLGIGVDISQEMILIAKKRYPGNLFIICDSENLSLKNKLVRYIIISDLIEHVPDVLRILEESESVIEDRGRLIINTINPLWGGILSMLETLNLKMPEGPHNFIDIRDIVFMAELLSFKIEKYGYFIFLPGKIFFISDILNRIIPHFPLLRRLCCAQYLIAQKEEASLERKNLSVSIIIPCFNEQENVSICLSRIPHMGSYQEVIFVNDGSVDCTEEKIKELMAGDERVRLVSYPLCQGKGHAVRKGFDTAKGDVLMILDADMSVMPEDLPKFFGVFLRDKADFVNGTRMVYTVKQSMHILHVLGNKIFSLIFTLLLKQRITDTLCGTKALLKKDYEKIKLSSKADPWGDFDLLLGAAKLGLRIKEMPVRYQKRIYGHSKMQPFKHGFILFLRVLRTLKEMKIDRLLKN